MATSMADLGFNIDSSPMRRATRELDRMSGASGKAERSSRQLASATEMVRNAVVGLTAAIGVREVVQYADTWQNVANQLRQVTSGTRELADIQSRLVRVAKDTRSNFDSTANLYARLARSTTEMGLSTEDLIGLTTTINQSFAVSGATATEAAAAITQLSQGLAAGALRGEEFNSVSEQAPALMRAISRSLNMTIGDLREFAAEGGITAEIVVNALRQASEEIDRNFNKTVATFGQNLEVAKTNLLEWVGTSSIINNSVGTLGDVVVGLSENIDTLVKVAGAAAAVFGARLAGSVATSTGAMVAAQVEAARYQATLASMAGVSRTAAASQAALAGAVRGAGGAMALLGGPAGLAILAGGALYYFRDSLFDTTKEASEAEEAVGKLTERMQGLTRAELQHERVRLARQMRENEKALADARAEVERLQKAQSESAAESMSGIGSVQTLARLGEASQRAGELARDNAALKKGLEQVDQAMQDLGASTDSTNEQAASFGSAADDLVERLNKIRNEVNPLGAEFARVGEQIRTVQEAMFSGDIGMEEGENLIKSLVEQMAEGGEEAGKEASEAFENPWQSTADSIAQSLQDAIASGDWDQIGDAIGNTLATSIAGIVSQTITDRLSRDLTSNSSTLAQIGGAFAGPIAGSVAGGAIQVAVRELGDFFSGSDWDPTEARQGRQGTGSVLGSIDAKSESIAKAVDVSANASRELVGINRDMLRALQTLQAGISGASGMIARAPRGGGIVGTSGNKGIADSLSMFPVLGQTSELAVDFFDEAINLFTFGMLDGFVGSAVSSVFGGKQKIKDVGIEFFSATLDEMIQGFRDSDRIITAQAFADIEEDGGWFGSDDRFSRYERLGDTAERQISLVFEGIRDSVDAGAAALGLSQRQIDRAIDAFRVQGQKISLEDMDAEQQTAALEAVFSTVFDNLAGAVVPFIDEFQMAGEGLGETLARIATQVSVTQEAVAMLGVRFGSLSGRNLVEASQRLVELNGGLETFIRNMQNFTRNFASEAQQFEINASALSRGLGDLPLPDTREGYYDLLQAQDAATAEGAENIATLLRLQGAANEYYSALEKASEQAQQAERARMNEQVSMQRDALRAAQQASSAVNSALSRMVLDSQSVQQASRTSALDALRRTAASGRVTATDQLDRNLSAATELQASDYATFGEYVRDYTRTTATLADLKEITDRQVSTEQRMLNSLEQQLEAVAGMRDDLERSQLAIIKQSNKTAKILERIELDGIEVRE